MRKLLINCILLAAALSIAGSSAWAQVNNPPSNQSFVAGHFVAKNYNYPPVQIAPGTNNAAGAATIALYQGSVRLADGRTIVPFSAGGFNIQGQPGAFPAIPITVGAGATKETVTPTAVSGCYVGAPQGSCKITATFSNAHGQGETVQSGSLGIQEAINDAAYFGGGIVEVDSSLALNYGNDATVQAAEAAALVMGNVSLQDDLNGPILVWNAQGGITTLGAPATLTATTVGFGLNGANTTTGTYTGASTYHVSIAYVDLMGQEGPGSADFSGLTAGTGTTNQIGFAAPAASTGAVGYTIYISLAAGSYNLSYKVPLTSSICTLTQIEVTTAACAVTNAGYGQTGSTAQVSALTLSTSPIVPQSTVISTTSVYVPNAGGRTTYTYVPGSHMGTPAMVAGYTPFVISAAAGTTVPSVLGTINLPPGIMNYVGRTLEICGYATTTGSTSTIENIQFQWDSIGQNTAGKGVVIGNMTGTTTLATTGHISFCEDFMTTISGAGATAGSIQTAGGNGVVAGVDLVNTVAVMGNTLTGAAGSLNLASEARINIIYLHTTGTDGAGYTLQSVSAKVIN